MLKNDVMVFGAIVGLGVLAWHEWPLLAGLWVTVWIGLVMVWCVPLAGPCP